MTHQEASAVLEAATAGRNALAGFLQSLQDRGMRGVKLVVSDDWETERSSLNMKAR